MPEVPAPSSDPPTDGAASPTWPSHLVLYDGGCALCHGWVKFLLRYDWKRQLHFAPLQGTTAAALRSRLPTEAPGVQSVILIEHPGTPSERVTWRSTAALRMLAGLGWPWKALAVFRLVPRPVRDVVYDLIARYRYRWFGQRNTCVLPKPETASRLWP